MLKILLLFVLVIFYTAKADVNCVYFSKNVNTTIASIPTETYTSEGYPGFKCTVKTSPSQICNAQCLNRNSRTCSGDAAYCAQYTCARTARCDCQSANVTAVYAPDLGVCVKNYSIPNLRNSSMTNLTRISFRGRHHSNSGRKLLQVTNPFSCQRMSVKTNDMSSELVTNGYTCIIPSSTSGYTVYITINSRSQIGKTTSNNVFIWDMPQDWRYESGILTFVFEKESERGQFSIYHSGDNFVPSGSPLDSRTYKYFSNMTLQMRMLFVISMIVFFMTVIAVLTALTEYIYCTCKRFRESIQGTKRNYQKRGISVVLKQGCSSINVFQLMLVTAILSVLIYAVASQSCQSTALVGGSLLTCSQSDSHCSYSFSGRTTLPAVGTSACISLLASDNTTHGSIVITYNRLYTSALYEYIYDHYFVENFAQSLLTCAGQTGTVAAICDGEFANPQLDPDHIFTRLFGSVYSDWPGKTVFSAGCSSCQGCISSDPACLAGRYVFKPKGFSYPVYKLIGLTRQADITIQISDDLTSSTTTYNGLTITSPVDTGDIKVALNGFFDNGINFTPPQHLVASPFIRATDGPNPIPYIDTCIAVENVSPPGAPVRGTIGEFQGKKWDLKETGKDLFLFARDYVTVSGQGTGRLAFDFAKPTTFGVNPVNFANYSDSSYSQINSVPYNGAIYQLDDFQIGGTGSSISLAQINDFTRPAELTITVNDFKVAQVVSKVCPIVTGDDGLDSITFRGCYNCVGGASALIKLRSAGEGCSPGMVGLSLVYGDGSLVFSEVLTTQSLRATASEQTFMLTVLSKDSVIPTCFLKVTGSYSTPVTIKVNSFALSEPTIVVNNTNDSDIINSGITIGGSSKSSSSSFFDDVGEFFSDLTNSIGDLVKTFGKNLGLGSLFNSDFLGGLVTIMIIVLVCVVGFRVVTSSVMSSIAAKRKDQ